MLRASRPGPWEVTMAPWPQRHLHDPAMSDRRAAAGVALAALLMAQLAVVPLLLGAEAPAAVAPQGGSAGSTASPDEARAPVWLGAVVGPQEQLGGGWQRRYSGGILYYSPASGVVALRNGGLLDHYRASGGSAGPLGYPTSDEAPAVSRTGETLRVASFSRGLVVHSPSHGSVTVSGAALGAYREQGLATGVLGAPTVPERAAAPSSRVRVAHFEHGSVFLVPGAPGSGAATQPKRIVLTDPLRRAYLDAGGPAGKLGPPASPATSTPEGLRVDFAQGALVLDAKTGRVRPPKPPPAPAATSSRGSSPMTLTASDKPTRSYYMTPNGNLSRDSSRAYSLGCSDARERVPGLRVLAFGGQETVGIRRPGLPETWQGPHLSYDAATVLAQSWVRGFVACRPGGLAATVALGANNYQWARQDTGANGGVLWAGFVDRVARWAEQSGLQNLTIVGANDIEPSWGPPDRARAWADAYARTTKRPMFAFASADGCPPSSVGGRCNNGWTVADVYHVSTGAGPGFYSVPQVYRTDGIMARQWAAISAWGAAEKGQPVRFAGVMTQQAACGSKPGCAGTDNSPRQAWEQTRQALDARSATRGSPLPGPTDITWMR